MAETRHSRLVGDELHGAKVAIGPRNRAPAYVGELLFDGSGLWIGETTQTGGWKPVSSPPQQAFSWVATFSYVEDWSTGGGDSVALTRAELWFVGKPAAQLGEGGPGWELAQRWTVGTNWHPSSPLLLTPWVQQQGVGCYAVVLFGTTANRIDGPLSGQRTQIVQSSPTTAATVISVGMEPIEVEPGVILGGQGFEVVGPFAEVRLNVGYQDSGA